LRQKNLERAHAWIETGDRIPTCNVPVDLFSAELPLPPRDLEIHRAHVLNASSVDFEVDSVHYGSPSSLSLLDLLPLFMKLSGTFQNLFNISASKTWFELASEWILQACLEQYLVYGSSGTDAMDEAFAWGYKPGKEGEEQEDKVNNIFKDDETEREMPGWKEMRQRMLRRLCPSTQVEGELVKHLLAASDEYPSRRTEDKILDYLKALSRSIDEPVLVQLEKGQLQGMTKEQTREFLTRDCGLDVGAMSPGGAVKGLL
jgi:hypothetical protein